MGTTATTGFAMTPTAPRTVMITERMGITTTALLPNFLVSRVMKPSKALVSTITLK